MARWECYLLGAFGLLLTASSIGLQIASFAAGKTWMALAFTGGVIGGAVLYGTGFGGLSG